MAKAKAKSTALVWVRALIPVQKPNRVWARVGDEFQVPEDKLSSRSMEKLSAEEAKAAEKRKAQEDREKPKDPKEALIEQLKADLATAQAGQAIMEEAADLLQVEMGDLIEEIKALKAKAAKPAPSALGANQTKDPDPGTSSAK